MSGVGIIFRFVDHSLVSFPGSKSDRAIHVITDVLIASCLPGICAILLNYRVDWEKEYFRAHNGKCDLWGQPATFIEAEYNTTAGPKRSKLLTSGFWGVARHLNYTFELLLALTWCLPGLGYSFWPFLYVIFLTVLLVHRVFRDEEKCRDKYGPTWDKYCREVPYRMIPWVF